MQGVCLEAHLLSMAAGFEEANMTCICTLTNFGNAPMKAFFDRFAFGPALQRPLSEAEGAHGDAFEYTVSREKWTSLVQPALLNTFKDNTQ